MLYTIQQVRQESSLIRYGFDNELSVKPAIALYPVNSLFLITDSEGSLNSISIFGDKGLPAECVRNIISYCSPFDFLNIRTTCKTFNSNADNLVYHEALIRVAADDSQQKTFFENLLLNETQGRKGKKFSSAFNTLVNITEDSLRSSVDYQIALRNFIQQINHMLESDYETTMTQKQKPSCDELKLIVKSTCDFQNRTEESSVIARSQLAQVNLAYAWNELPEQPRLYKQLLHQYMLSTGFIYDWDPAALTSILKTLHIILMRQNSQTSEYCVKPSPNCEGGVPAEKAHTNSIKIAPSYNTELNKAVDSTIKALKIPANCDCQTFAKIWKDLLELAVAAPEWKINLNMAMMSLTCFVRINHLLSGGLDTLLAMLLKKTGSKKLDLGQHYLITTLIGKLLNTEFEEELNIQCRSDILVALNKVSSDIKSLNEIIENVKYHIINKIIRILKANSFDHQTLTNLLDTLSNEQFSNQDYTSSLRYAIVITTDELSKLEHHNSESLA